MLDNISMCIHLNLIRKLFIVTNFWTSPLLYFHTLAVFKKGFLDNWNNQKFDNQYPELCIRIVLWYLEKASLWFSQKVCKVSIKGTHLFCSIFDTWCWGWVYGNLYQISRVANAPFIFVQTMPLLGASSIDFVLLRTFSLIRIAFL